MTPRLMNAASSGPSKPRESINHRMDFATLGRAPLRLSLGTKRITSTDLQIAEATEELLAEEIPEPEGVAQDISLLRGFNATIPSSQRGKTRRRQMRNVDTPHMGLKKLGMNARGLLTEDDDSGMSEDDLVIVARSNKSRGKQKEKTRLKGKRRARESFGATVSLGQDELKRQTQEILLDKENIHVRRVCGVSCSIEYILLMLHTGSH
jgi:division protein 1